MKALLLATAVIFTFFSAPIFAADAMMKPGTGSATATPTAAVMTNAEVRRVDKAAKKITLKHEDIKNLNMPAMTMVFQVKDPAMLDKVKLGDKVRFAAEDVGGAITVTQIEMAK